MRILAFLLAVLSGLATASPAAADVRVTTRTYDLLDRLETETVALEDGGLATVRYGYWEDGRRRTVTDAFGRVTSYEYDGRGNLARVTANQGLPDQHVTTYAYWPDNLVKTITKPNGTVSSFDYDRADRLTSVFVRLGASVLVSYEYTYDPNGNRLTQVETNGGPPETTTYSYDSLNRLETVAYPDGKTFAYQYDAVGNRTREIERNPAGVAVSDKTAVFDAINRLTTITDAVDPSGSATLAWDRNGNLLSKTTPTGVEEYSYDARDLMAETRAGPSVLARNAYDPFGRRHVKLGLEDLRQYVYDETSTLHELDDDDAEVAKYEYGGDSLLSFVRRDEPRRFYHLDGLGSPTALTDSAGSIVTRYHLDAWGRYRTPSELSASANRFGFTGYLFDQETDLFYAKARFYDPEIGRFTSQDSVLGQVDEPPSLNRYFYGNANPLRFVDPTGHSAESDSKAFHRELLAARAKAACEAAPEACAARRAATEARQVVETSQGVHLAGATLRGAGATALALTPEPTFLTKLAALYFAFTAGDDLGTLGREVVTQQPQKTGRTIALEEGLRSINPENVEQRAATVEFLVDLGVPAAGGPKALLGPPAFESGRLPVLIGRGVVETESASLIGQGQSIVQRQGGTFILNEKGQVLNASGELTLKPAPRDAFAQAQLPGKAPGDQAGHLLGARFGFSGGQENLTPMTQHLNLSAYKKLENHLARLVKGGHKVTMDVHPVYQENALRPDRIVVSYTVDGRAATIVLSNPPPQTPRK